MKKHLFAIATLLVMPAATAHDFDVGSMYIDHPMVEEAPPSARVLGGFVSLHNQGAEDDRLIAIESSAAERVEIHRSVVTDGIARMTPLTDGVDLPASSIVWIGSDGTHAMFIGPDRRYVAGDEIPAALVFENAGRIGVTFKVEERSSNRVPGHVDHVQ